MDVSMNQNDEEPETINLHSDLKNIRKGAAFKSTIQRTDNPFRKYQGSSDSDEGDEDSEKEIKVPKQFKNMIKKYQDLLLAESGEWKVINYVDKVQISGLDLVREDVVTSYKPLKGALIKVLLIFLIFNFIRMFIYEIPLIIPGIVAGYLLY